MEMVRTMHSPFDVGHVGSEGQVKRFIERGRSVAQSTGRINVRRIRTNHHTWWASFWADPFHSVIHHSTIKIMAFFCASYLFTHLLFSLVYYMVDESCDLQIKSLLDAMYLSLEVGMTIGWGLPGSPYMKQRGARHGCFSGVGIVYLHTLTMSMQNALMIGLIYCRMSRGTSRQGITRQIIAVPVAPEATGIQVLDREGAGSVISHKDELDAHDVQKVLSVRRQTSFARDLEKMNQDQLQNMAYEIEAWLLFGEPQDFARLTSSQECPRTRTAFVQCRAGEVRRSKHQPSPTRLDRTVQEGTVFRLHVERKICMPSSEDLSPRWDVYAHITDFHYGDSLGFTVWDKDFGKADDALGQASLPSEKIIPHGFDEWLVLDGTGTKGVVSSADDISSIREQTRHEEPVVQPVRNSSKEGSRSPGLHSPYSGNLEKNGHEGAGQAFKEDIPAEKFELFLAGLLCLNICSMALELQYDGWEIGYLLDYGFYQSSIQDRFAWGNDFLYYVDMVFSVPGSKGSTDKALSRGKPRIDVTLRISILQGMFWRGGISNYIDLLVVVLILRLIRFGKLVRALKVVRISQSLESLAFLMSCLRASGTVLVWTMSLLACIQCIAALFASNVLHFFLVDNNIDVEEILFANWAPACRVLTDNVTEWWTLFFLLYRCLVGFAVLNVVNAVFVQSTLKVAHADEELQFAAWQKFLLSADRRCHRVQIWFQCAREEAKQKAGFAAQRNLMNKLQNMFLALDTSGDGLLSWDEFNEAISSPKMAFWMSQLELESSDLKSLFTLLDGGDGLISVNEFMEGATRLRGPAKSIDVAKLLMLCTKTEKTLKAGLASERDIGHPRLEEHLMIPLEFGRAVSYQRSDCLFNANASRSGAASLVFSEKAVIREIGGKFYFMFQVCESKKHQLVEAKVRCYALCTGLAGDQSPSGDGAHQGKLEFPLLALQFAMVLLAKAVALGATPPMLVERLTSKPGRVRCQVPQRGAPSTSVLAGSVVVASVFARHRTNTWATPVVTRARAKQTRKAERWHRILAKPNRPCDAHRARRTQQAASWGKAPKSDGLRRSRLDNTQDIRLEGSMGEVLPETADTICFVPEPYVRAQRPDQRVRSTAALSDSEAITDTLEKAGIWFRPLPAREEHFREMSDDELRERLRDVAELVSGSRREMLKRLYGKKANFASWTKAEVETECYRLGCLGSHRLEVLEKKADNVVNIKNALEWQQIRNLSDEDLAYELSYRGLDSEDRETDEENLQAYLDGRMF
eukprot:s326_g15.t1